MTIRFSPLRASIVVCCLLLSTTLLTSCTDDEAAQAVTSFQQASSTLEQAYKTLVNNANQVEENNYIDGQAFERKPIAPKDIEASAIMTPDEIKLRVSVIQALSDYTTALATLATGKPAASIETDAKTASTSLKTLTTDAGTALKAPSAATTKISGPISTAVAAAGDVIELIEKHRGEQEVKTSLAKNDPQVVALFQLIEAESADLYARQKATTGAVGVRLFADYSRAANAKADPAVMLNLSDRIKQYQANQASLGSADPAPAIAAFQKAHDTLVTAILAPREQKKQSLTDLIAAAKSFAAEVTPLAQDLQAFAKSI